MGQTIYQQQISITTQPCLATQSDDNYKPCPELQQALDLYEAQKDDESSPLPISPDDSSPDVPPSCVLCLDAHYTSDCTHYYCHGYSTSQAGHYPMACPECLDPFDFFLFTFCICLISTMSYLFQYCWSFSFGLFRHFCLKCNRYRPGHYDENCRSRIPSDYYSAPTTGLML
jgi:hypothetical protein